MSNMQKVIERLSVGNAAGGNLTSDACQDEPIIITAAKPKKSAQSKKYREMRRIGNRFKYESDEKIFYRQGEFMENFEDDFDYRGQFARYLPTYQSMDSRQLRGYFSWRTKVRRGVIEKTQLSFAFVYIYELLNQIGVSSPEEGFYKLKNFWVAYREIAPKINSHVKLWLKDYIVYNNLDKSLLEDFPEGEFDNEILTLLNHKAYDTDTVFSALNSISTYSMKNSILFKRHPDDVKDIIYDVYSTLADYYGKNNLREKFFGKIYANSYVMFQAAVFHHHADRNNFVYEISEICKYECKNGTWIHERLFPYREKSHQVGALLKNIDLSMRRKYGLKLALKEEKTTKILQYIITEAVDYHQENKKKAALPKVEINVSKLQNIRNVALEIQNKLTVEEIEEEADVTDSIKFFDEKTERRDCTGLNDVEHQFMNCLLYGKAYDDLVRSNGLMLSVLIDTINERLFDVFGDTVIIDDGGEPVLIEDYVDALKGIIRK